MDTVFLVANCQDTELIFSCGLRTVLGYRLLPSLKSKMASSVAPLVGSQFTLMSCCKLKSQARYSETEHSVKGQSEGSASQAVGQYSYVGLSVRKRNNCVQCKAGLLRRMGFLWGLDKVSLNWASKLAFLFIKPIVSVHL